MLPAPARIAAMPNPKSRECWNPAVPPPPVAGAAVGNGLGVAEGLGVGLGDGAAVGLTLGLGVVPLGRVVGVGEPVAPGEMGGGDAPGEDEQAETVAEASMAKVAQPATVNLARWLVPFITGTLRYAIGATGGRQPQPAGPCVSGAQARTP
jgi:hypothetical protein